MKRTPWHVRAGTVVLLWLTAALAAGIAALFSDVPHWLLVHLLLLGAASNAILIWSSHFAAALLRLPDADRQRDEAVRLGLFNGGGVLVIVGMTAAGDIAAGTVLVLAGAALTAGAAIWHALDLTGRMRRALPSRFGETVRYYVIAAAFLPFGIALGVILSGHGLPDERTEQLVLAHLSINVLGWMGLTVLGTLVTLWPTMLHTQVAEGTEVSARRALPVLAGSVAVLACASLAGSRAITALGIAGYLAGMVIVGIPRAQECRRRPPSTYATRSVLAAVLWFGATVAALGVVIATAGDWETAAERADHLAGPLLVGFAAQLLLGALSFLIPVVLGGGPTMARRTNALLDRGAAVRLGAVNAGLVLSLLPLDDGVHVAAVLVMLIGLGSFLPLAIGAFAAARRPTPA